MQIDLTWNLFLTAILLPSVGFMLARLIKRADKLNDERHLTLLSKINQYCEDNHEDHSLNREEHAKIYNRVDEHEKRISKVEGHLKI